MSPYIKLSNLGYLLGYLKCRIYMDIKTQYEIIINSKTLIIKGLRDNAISYEIVIRHPPSAPFLMPKLLIS